MIKRISRVLIVTVLLLGIVIPGSGIVTSPGAYAADPVEIIESRTANSKLYDMGNGKYALSTSIGAIHYDNNGSWNEIDNSWYSSIAPWDWSMKNAGYTTKVKADFTAGQIMEFEKDGSTINFQPMALEWTNDISQIQSISMPQDVYPILSHTPSALLTGVNNDIGYVTWNDAYGSGLDFTWTNTPSKLQKLLTISGLADLPPPAQYVIDGGNANIRLNYIFAPSSELEIYADGVLWDRITRIVTTKPVEFRKNGETIWEFSQPLYWDSSTEAQPLIGHTELRRSGKSLNVSTLVPYEWLQTAVYPVYIDPTVDIEVGASSDDVYAGNNDGTGWNLAATTGYFGRNYGNFPFVAFRFEDVGLPTGATITTSYVTMQSVGNYSNVANADIFIESAENPATFTDWTNFSERSWETAVDWDGIEIWTTDNLFDTPSLNTPLQSVVDANDADEVAVYIQGLTSSSSEGLRRCNMYDRGGYTPASLYTEYTEGGGVSAPTVVTNAAEDVEETTATLSGNIMATGGENASIRGFEWDTDTGAPYSANWTENGDYGTGVFTHGVTSLTKGELHYYRAMALNSEGWGYGSEVTFLTKPDPATAFISTDNGTSWISLSWTNGTGMDYAEIRYSDSDYPTDNVTGSAGYWGSVTSANITGLSDNATYYFSLFTHANEGGLWTTADTYATATDKTDEVPVISAPTVVTNGASSVEETTATLSGNITDTGGENASIRGFEWDTDTGAPYSANWTESDDYGTGVFTHGITGLTKGDLYYYRAMAYNSEGWGYGDEVTFLNKPDEPTGLTDNGIGTDWINVEWVKGTGAQKTLVRYKTGSYPSNISDGTQAYFDTGTSVNVTSLSPNVTHYFRAWSYATEGVLEQYSDATSDDTALTLTAAPTVTNSTGASNVTDNDARLNGELTDSGGDNPAVIVFWGEVDGETTPGDWSDNYSLGTKAEGTFYHDLTDSLDPETLYYYRMRAVNGGGADWADTSANFTTTEVVAVLLAPATFTLTDGGAISIIMEWAQGTGSTYTMIRAKRGEYPGISTGELVYYGSDTSANMTGCNLDITEYYFIAWGFDSDNITYSSDNINATIGGDSMDNIATELTSFNLIMANFYSMAGQITIIIIITSVCALALIRRELLYYAIAFPVLSVAGFSLAAGDEVFSYMWLIGVMSAIMGLYHLYCIIILGLKTSREGNNGN